MSDTETESSSGAISVEPKGESNPLLHKVTATVLKVSPTLADALSFCLQTPSSLPPPLPFSIQQVMAASNGVTSRPHRKKCSFQRTALNIHTTEGKGGQQGGANAFSLGNCIHQRVLFAHLCHEKKRSSGTLVLTIKDCLKTLHPRLLVECELRHRCHTGKLYEIISPPAHLIDLFSQHNLSHPLALHSQSWLKTRAIFAPMAVDID